MIYPTKAELDRMGVTLEHDVDFCSDDLRRWFGRPNAVRTQAERADTPKRVVAWPRKRAGKRIA